MEVIALGTKHTLSSPLFSAGEGEIYAINSNNVAKIYWPDIQTKERKLKVLALCNSYANNLSLFGSESFAFPESPTYESVMVFDHICGFTMKYFVNVEKLDALGFNLKQKKYNDVGGFKFTDHTAVDFSFALFELINKLHTSRIILGDINGANILIDRSRINPIIVDIDSSQFGQFKCIAYTEEYLDPLIEKQGRNLKGGFEYNTESDIFALTCLVYEFFVGVNPFFFNNDKGNGPVKNKQEGVAFLSFIQQNASSLNGITLNDTQVNRNILDRVNQLKAVSPRMYEYFVSILVNGERNSLMQTLTRDDPRHPAFVFYSQSGFNESLKLWKEKMERHKNAAAISKGAGLPDSGFSRVIYKDLPEKIEFIQRQKTIDTADPIELKQFLANYNIKMSDLILN